MYHHWFKTLFALGCQFSTCIGLKIAKLWNEEESSRTMLIANWSATMFISHIYDTPRQHLAAQHSELRHLGNCVVQRTACFQTCRDIGIRSSKQQHQSVVINQPGGFFREWDDLVALLDGNSAAGARPVASPATSDGWRRGGRQQLRERHCSREGPRVKGVLKCRRKQIRLLLQGPQPRTWTRWSGKCVPFSSVE
jgi:hypothetical protein